MSDIGYGDFEFERKFLVRGLPAEVRAEHDPVLIVQSYFLASEGYALRVRVQAPATALDGGAAVDLGPGLDLGAVLERITPQISFCGLTAKGPEVAGTRYEAERELDAGVGVEMIRRGGRPIVKYRHSLWLGTDGWAIDAFLGQNAPLIIAECERGGPVTDLVIPEFCVTEVTDDPRFTNDALSARPFAQWSAEIERELATRGPRFLNDFGRNQLPGGTPG